MRKRARRRRRGAAATRRRRGVPGPPAGVAAGAGEWRGGTSAEYEKRMVIGFWCQGAEGG
ncbi:hypothetical protein STTU_6275 [Streptomyces sp. Tu6071]|nr:hypothetical protein STTU_6275 [Streptomyces sp. Tu6071]